MSTWLATKKAENPDSINVKYDENYLNLQFRLNNQSFKYLFFNGLNKKLNFNIKLFVFFNYYSKFEYAYILSTKKINCL